MCSRHFAAMNAVYAKHFGDRPPTRATVEADLALPGGLVEITLLAARPGAEDAWPVGWRDASGAGWLGRLALSPDADPAWSGAVLAIGVGGAPLSGGDHRPGVVAVAPLADAGWPAAPVEGWSSGADLDADASDGLVVGLVPAGAAACPWQSASRL